MNEPTEVALEIMPRAGTGVERFEPLNIRLADYVAQSQALVITADMPTDEQKQIAVQARRMRLDLFRALRLETRRLHGEAKEGINEIARTLDKAERTIRQQCEAEESRLEEIETFQQRQEERRRKQLHADRLALITPYLTGPVAGDLASLTEEQFQQQLTDARELFALRKQREEKERQEREEAERRRQEQEAEERRRREEEQERIRAEAEARRVEVERLKAEAERKEKEREAELQRIREEQARREAAAEKERKEAEERSRKELAELERKQRAEAARVAAENEAKRKAEAEAARCERERLAAEKAEAERIAAEERRKREAAEQAQRAEAERQRKEAEAKAAEERRRRNAPDIEKVRAFASTVSALDLPSLTADNAAAAAAIAEQRTKFAAWLAAVAAKMEGSKS